MRRFKLFLSAGFGLLTFAGALTTLTAQDGAGRRGGGGAFFGGGFTMTMDKATLLGSPKVREELKLKEDQAKKVEEILAAHQQEIRGISPGGRGGDLSQEEREKRRKENSEKAAAVRKKTDEKIAAALEKEQLARLSEIELQQQGVDGLVSDSVVASLKLEKAQVEKIRAAMTARDEERQKLRGGPGGPGGGGDFQAMREKLDKIRKDADEKALAVLTKDQQTALEKLKGKPFELDRASLGRGQGGNRAGGRAGGGGPGAPGGAGAKGSGDASKEKKRPSDDDK